MLGGMVVATNRNEGEAMRWKIHVNGQRVGAVRRFGGKFVLYYYSGPTLKRSFDSLEAAVAHANRITA
jgi:hypothetical protein